MREKIEDKKILHWLTCSAWFQRVNIRDFELGGNGGGEMVNVHGGHRGSKTERKKEQGY